MKWEPDDRNYRSATSANDNPGPRGPYEEWLLEQSLGARHMIRRHFFKDDANQNFLIVGGGNGVDSFEAPLPLRSTSLPDDRFAIRIDGGYDKGADRIAAVIDDSFNFMNRRFTYRADEKLVSRFAKVWVQDADHGDQKSMRYGRVLDASDITQMIRDVEAGKAEEEVLEEAGLISDMDKNYLPSAMRGRWSHGTHIADLFAGLPPDHVQARGTALLAVQLPPMATYDTSGLTLTGVVMDAIEFTFKHAEAMSKEVDRPLPLVLNFSYGFTGGPRTGRTMLEQKLFDMAKEYKAVCKTEFGTTPDVDLVIPCGNSRLSQTHVIARETGGEITLKTAFRVQPNDETSSFLELWAPTGTKNFRFTFEAPGAEPLTGECELDEIGMTGETSDERGKIAFNLMRDGQVVARVRHDRPFDKAETSKYPLDYLHRFVVSIAPTQPLDDSDAAAPHGLWRCAITCDAPEDTAIEGWILRDERVAPTPPRGRQAYFEDAGAAESTFDDCGALGPLDFANSPQSRDRTISNMASTGFGMKDVMGPNVHIVAGVFAGPDPADTPYKLISDEIMGQITSASKRSGTVPYSATWKEQGPPSTEYGYCDARGPISGLPGEGVREGASIRLNGTSVAAPRFARTLLFRSPQGVS